jgi:hypothetical protein
MIRAKFRCMSVTRDWNNAEVAEFRPVKRDGDKDSENKKFWDASPSGSATLTFKGPCGYKPGDYYYIDMEMADEGKWGAGTISRHSGGGGSVKLYRNWEPVDEGMIRGDLEMGVSYANVLDLFGLPDGKWNVVFSFAEKSDG